MDSLPSYTIAPYQPHALARPSPPARPGAQGDSAVLAVWLSIFDLKSRATARHYRTQAGKFLLFLQLLHPDWAPDTHLKQASEQDVAMYEMALLLKPMPGGARLDLTLPEAELARLGLAAQPFAMALKKSSVNQALSVLNALYEFLRTPNGAMPQPYVSINPVKRVRKSVTRSLKQTDRHIPLDGIQAMNDYLLAAIARARQCGEPKRVVRYERMRWIFTLLFGLWGRREEVSQLSMGDFRQLHDGSWKVLLKRKGAKEQEVPAADWVVMGLRQYRASLGLPMAWDREDPAPAVQAMRLIDGKPSTVHVTPQTLYLEVKALACETADELSCGALLPGYSPERRVMLAERLVCCSPHWFRHSGPTIAINSGAMSVENASKMLGHTSLSITTQMYFHADDEKTRTGLDRLGEQLGARATLSPRAR